MRLAIIELVHLLLHKTGNPTAVDLDNNSTLSIGNKSLHGEIPNLNGQENSVNPANLTLSPETTRQPIVRPFQYGLPSAARFALPLKRSGPRVLLARLL